MFEVELMSSQPGEQSTEVVWRPAEKGSESCTCLGGLSRVRSARGSLGGGRGMKGAG